MRPPWVSEMWPWLGACLGLSVAGLLGQRWLPGLGWRWLALLAAAVGVCAAVVCLVFFRDPERPLAAGPGQIVAPADGRVMTVTRTFETKYFQGPATRISIFMHLGNVHVQRLPAAGRLIWTRHYPGSFLPAFTQQASVRNEQQWYALDCGGRKLAVVQIAGLLARRIRCWLQEGQDYPANQRLGMIVLGSEVDVYLPVTAAVHVQPGSKVFAGVTVIATWQ